MSMITKAVFPVAGLGTRFLPATKAIPKEMMPIVDKPIIEYAVQEAIDAGITEIVFVINHTKHSIEEHFDNNLELEKKLLSNNKKYFFDLIHDIIPKKVKFLHVRQLETAGLGHSILCAREVIKDQPFAIILPDDLIHTNQKNCLQQMINLYEQHPANIIAVEKVSGKAIEQYGVVSPVESATSQQLLTIKDIIEKPKYQDAPSDLGVVGRYILSPKIFDYLAIATPGAGGEIQLTDSIAKLLQEQATYAYKFNGTRYDCGRKLGYMQALLNYAVEHPEIGQQFCEYISDFAKTLEQPLPSNKQA